MIVFVHETIRTAIIIIVIAISKTFVAYYRLHRMHKATYVAKELACMH